MRQTSILAYADVKKNLGPKQILVLEALEDISPASDKDLALHLGWPINTVTPRRGELFKKNRVVEAYVQKDITGRKQTYWKPKVTGGYFDEVR